MDVVDAPRAVTAAVPTLNSRLATTRLLTRAFCCVHISGGSGAHGDDQSSTSGGNGNKKEDSDDSGTSNDPFGTRTSPRYARAARAEPLQTCSFTTVVYA